MCQTQLHVAACNGWLDAMSLLLNNHADVHAKDEDGNTPLHLAVFFLQYKVVFVFVFFRFLPSSKFFFFTPKGGRIAREERSQSRRR